MKKRFGKIIKIFFAFGMLFSQLYSPLTVFAEVVEDIKEETETETLEDIVEKDTEDIEEVETNDIDSQIDIQDDTEELDDSNNIISNDNEVSTIEQNSQLLEEPIESLLEVEVNGNVGDASYNEESNTYTYELLEDAEDLVVTMIPELGESESIKLVINDKYTLNLTEDFKLDFDRIASGSYKFVFSNDNQDSKTIEIVSNHSSYEDDIVDVILSCNNKLGMEFDSVNKRITMYGSTLNNSLTIENVVNDINQILENLSVVTDISEIKDETIYTGLELSLLYDDVNYDYTLVAFGDVDEGTEELDKDNNVTYDDVKLIVDFSLGFNEEILGTIYEVASDINRDGLVDVLDATQTIKAIESDSFELLEANTNSYNVSLVSNDTVKVGEILEVSFDFDSASFNGIEGILNYNKDLLSLASVSFNDVEDEEFNYGTLNYDNNKFMFVGVSPIDNITFIFDVIGEGGDTSVSISDLKLADNGNLLNTSSEVSKDILVFGPINSGMGTGGEDEEVVVDTPSVTPSVNVEYVIPVRTVTYSSNSYLDSLTIEGYDIEFNRDIYEYSVNVSNDVTSLNIIAMLADPSASYQVFGNSDFKEGENIVTVVVTAQDGSTSTYTIKVNKQAPTIEKEEIEESTTKNNTVLKTVVIILIILVIIGLIYLIFKDDEEDDNENHKAGKNNGSNGKIHDKSINKENKNKKKE